MSEQFPGWLVYVSAIAYALAFKKLKHLNALQSSMTVVGV